jgi:hypothetical protein
MVPVLNAIGTDVACVGVRGILHTSIEHSSNSIPLHRTTTSTSESDNIDTSPPNATSPGSSQTSLTQLSVKTYPSETQGAQ